MLFDRPQATFVFWSKRNSVSKAYHFCRFYFGLGVTGMFIRLIHKF